VSHREGKTMNATQIGGITPLGRGSSRGQRGVQMSKGRGKGPTAQERDSRASSPKEGIALRHAVGGGSLEAKAGEIDSFRRIRTMAGGLHETGPARGKGASSKMSKKPREKECGEARGTRDE